MTNATLPPSTNLLITTTLYPENKKITGLEITCIYGASHIVLLLLLALKLYWKSKNEGEKLSLSGYFYAIWKDREIYASVLVHIYDTATGIVNICFC